MQSRSDEPGALPDDTGVKDTLQAAYSKGLPDAYAQTWAGQVQETNKAVDGVMGALGRILFGANGPPEPVYYRDGVPLDKWRPWYAVNWTAVLCTSSVCITALVIITLLIATGVMR